MNVLMTGGTGFIGSKLVDKLVQEGHHVYIITRNPQKHDDTSYTSYISFDYPMKRLPFIHAIVNLAGESIFGYWSEEKKTAILKSRMEMTNKLIQLLLQMNEKPHVFLSGSAIGYYGMSNDIIYTEATKQHGNDFLANVSDEWENAALLADNFGVRTVLTRFGLVLHEEEGALPMMALPIHLFLGGKIGTGKQWISWIHWEDCINLLYVALTNQHMEGPVNITAPYPVRNKQFVALLAKSLNRPACMPAPKAAFQLAFGDMHQLITEGQYVLPKKALDFQFTFKYPHLHDALKQLYK